MAHDDSAASPLRYFICDKCKLSIFETETAVSSIVPPVTVIIAQAASTTILVTNLNRQMRQWRGGKREIKSAVKSIHTFTTCLGHESRAQII